MTRRVLLATERGVRTVDGEVAGLADRRVTALAGASGGWLAVIDRRTVADDSGLQADVSHATLTCVAAAGDGALVGTDGAGLVRVDRGTVTRVAGFADADGRTTWYTPWGGPPATRSIAVAPDGTLFVNVHVGGILRSHDDGRTWRQTIDIDVDVHQVLTAPSGVVLAACGAGGLAVSDDRGDSWRWHTSGLHATYCRAVAVAGQTVLISAAQGPRGGQAAVYRRAIDGDGPFERCTVGLPSSLSGNIDTHRLAGRGDAAAFAAADGRVFVSCDAGASWDQAAPTGTVAAVIIA